MSNLITSAFAERLLAALPPEGATLPNPIDPATGKPRRGRPAFAATASKVANEYNRLMPMDAQAIAQEDPFTALAIFGALRRELTDEEKAELAKTSDAEFQGLLNGEPCQTEIRAGFEFSSPEQGREMFYEAVVPYGCAMARLAGEKLYARIRRWAVSRKARSVTGSTLDELPARYQHKIYVTSNPAKLGFLNLGVFHPTGEFESFAVPQNLDLFGFAAPVETVETAPAEPQDAPNPVEATETLVVEETAAQVEETLKERKNRLARARRAAAKAPVVEETVPA